MMKMFNLAVLCACLALGLTAPADAALYTISFNDGNGDVGSGQINVESANNNFYAASGYLDVTAGGASGDWTLYTAGGTTPYPGYIYSPSGAFIYNNAVYPTGSNPQYPDTNPLLDYYGLLFTQNNGNELNLWGNADGTYTLGGNVDGYQNFNANIGFGGAPGDPMIAPVPEPSTFITALCLLAPISVSALRLHFRKEACNIAV